MKKFILAVLCFALTIPAAAMSAGPIMKVPDIQIIAHRGASGHQPENTLNAFRYATALGNKFFETDVQMTKDGVLVLIHDYKYQGNIIKDTAQSKLNLTTLKSLLDYLPEDAALNIEIKNDGGIYPGIETAVMDMLNGYGEKFKSKIVISSFDYPTLQRVRALDAKIKIGVLMRSFDIDAADALDAYSVNMSKDIVTKKIVKEAHAHGMKVFVYTVNSYSKIVKLDKMGVDGVFSDYPDILMTNVEL
ncbi:glycerophosphoryl diester phosphodiesterase [Elusimicrobium simillimum]|uniref:glycerophosphodiester phosphodiesterase n=1 Tax=Elusimicrobium simillimum TaxID=3143438 RepID=UPI003C7010E1